MRMQIKKTQWRRAGILAALALIPLIFAITPAAPQKPPGNQTIGAKAFPPALDTPFKNPPRPIIGALRQPLDHLPQIENFQVIGETIITNPGQTIERGRNGGLAIADNCLYVGNRLGRRSGTSGAAALPPEVAIVDISNPSKPEVVGRLPTILNATTREVRAFGSPLNTLFVQNFRVGLPDAATSVPDSDALNNIQIYDLSSGCRNPRLTATVRLDSPSGPDNARPHEFFVWIDPNNLGRVLLYVSFSGGDDVPDLRVYEVLNPPNPSNLAMISTPIASFTLDPAIPRNQPVDPARWDAGHLVFQPARPTSQATNVHAMSVSADGTRVYMANRGAGFFILDSSNLADSGKAAACTRHTVTMDESTNADPNLCLRKVNPDPKASINLIPPYRGITHTAVPVPSRPYVLIGGERNGTNTCPWTWGWIAHTVDETNPQVVSRFMVPENLAENCFEGGPGDPALEREFSTHQITAFPNLFFISWYSAGLRAWDISNPNLPLEVGVFVPEPRAQVVERFRNSPDVWVWPYPLLHNGLIYIADENGGLYILKFKGPRADELPQEGTFQGNANNP